MDVFKPLSDIIPQESRYQIEEESKEEVKEEINQDRPDESLTNAQPVDLRLFLELMSKTSKID